MNCHALTNVLCLTVLAALMSGCSHLKTVQPIALLTKQTADGEIAGWKSFHETPGTRTDQVWKLGTDGVLVCQGKPLGYLYTTQDYQDFVLTFEWRWPRDVTPRNGGVLVRTTGEDKVWPKSLEIQLNAGQAGDFWGIGGYQLSGAPERTRRMEHEKFGRLTHVPKISAVEKPVGEWNQGEVRLKGDKVTLHMNGQLVNEADGCDQVGGRILLTAEGQEIHFRNLMLLRTP
jgi:hypothetical protein